MSPGAKVELIEVGPAHTKGDPGPTSPTPRTMYTGDILFIHGTPIVWAGPLSQLGRRVRPHAEHGPQRRRARATAR